MVTLPAGSTILRAWPKDLEGDRLTTRWTVVRHPAGAAVALETIPKDRSKTARRATGMTVAGEYVFTATAVDRTRAVTRRVRLNVGP